MRKINNLEVWRFFVEAVDSGGISAAADKLGVETSSVSRALRTLESEIGAALWKRSVRPARLTSLGEEVYSRVRELLAQHASLESFLFEDLNVMEGPIRICSQTMLKECGESAERANLPFAESDAATMLKGARFDEPRALFSGQKQVPLRGPVVVIKGGPCRRGRPCSS